MKRRSLIGTPETCAPFVAEMAAAGVDEVCCLIDFLQDYDAVMTALPYLDDLKTRCEAEAAAPPRQRAG